jgi:hypothetical protein
MHGKLRNIRFYWLKSFFFPFFFSGNLLQVVGLGLSTVYICQLRIVYALEGSYLEFSSFLIQ